METKNKLAIDFVFVLLGCILLAFAITAILEPNHLITGGITGLSLILDNITGISYTYFYYLFSLLILVVMNFVLGRREAKKILLLSIVFPIILMIFNALDLKLIEDDLILAAFYYGVIGGAGVGFILKRGYSTGGTDSIAKMLHKKRYPFISVNQIITIIDILIIIVSIFTFNIRIALYAIITQLVLLKSVEAVLYGMSPKLVKLEIISTATEEISEYILKEVIRGVSKSIVVGGYSNKEKKKIMTVCSPRESMLIKVKIASLDDRAFVNVLPVVSVWGEGLGFTRIRDEE